MDAFNASRSAAEHSESSDQTQNRILPSDTLEARGSRNPDIDDSISKDQEEELQRVSRVRMLSDGVGYYRHCNGLASVVPWFVHLIAEPGLESWIDDSRIFHTLFEDLLLDTLKVAEKIWAEHRPLVLSRLACGQLEIAERKENTKTFVPTGVFRFLELPGELRNKIYVHMLRPRISLKDLTGKTSDWFNPAILCTSRQINSESSAIYNEQIAVLVDPMAVACYQEGLHRLPVKSQFKRCLIDVDMSVPRLVKSLTGETFPNSSIAWVGFDNLVEDLRSMRFLEELRLSCKWITCLEDKLSSSWSQAISNNNMECFRKLKGLKKFVIEGAFVRNS